MDASRDRVAERVMGAVLYRFRAELRTRWRAWTGLALIVGITAGAVICLAAGSRRTSTAYDRFLTAQSAYDVGVILHCEPPSAETSEPAAAEAAYRNQSCLDQVSKLPAVAESTTVREFPGYVETTDGVSLQPITDDPCYSGPGQVSAVADPSGRFGTTFNASRITAGRRADPSAPDEVVISKDIADQHGLEPGDSLRVHLFDGADCLDNPATWRKAQTLRIVGVGLTPGEVPPPSGMYLATIQLTKAFVREAGAVVGTHRYVMVRLSEDATVRDLSREATGAGYAIDPVLSAREQAEQLRDGSRPVAFSLALIAALLAVAAIAVVGQILVRQAYVESGDRVTLAAIGLTPRRQFGLAMLRAAFVGAVGAAVAVVVAIAASPLMPVGVARDVEPAAGISVDPVAIALGCVGTLLFVVLVSLLPAWRLAGRPAPVRESGGRSARMTVATAMAQRGISPVPVSGVRLALDRGSGTRAVPVWSSLVGLIVAATTLIGAVTFGAGLTHLLDTPRLIGWNWDFIAFFPEAEVSNDPDASARWIEQMKVNVGNVPAVDQFATGTFWPPFPQGRQLQLGSARVDTPLLAFDPGSAVGPSVIAGRAPRAPHEILLGADTIDVLGLSIGDTVNAIGQAGSWDEAGEETSARMRIVGTGVVPGSELGQGATMTLDGVARLNELAFGDAIYVRHADGVDDRELRAVLGREFGSTPEMFGPRFADPGGKLVDLRETNNVPALLGALMALMAAAVLAHVLVSGIGHHRRDLALLRTLGFTRRQVSRTVGWQASTYTLITLVVSLPLGVALGRTIWLTYAESIGVVPESVTPWGALAAILVAAFVIANLIAALPAWRATRAAPAAILRTE